MKIERRWAEVRNISPIAGSAGPRDVDPEEVSNPKTLDLSLPRVIEGIKLLCALYQGLLPGSR